MATRVIEWGGRRWYSYDRTDGKRPYFKNRRGQLLHRCIYERELGPIPDGYEIHHRDGDPLNNDPGNLEALSRADHMRVDVQPRMREALARPDVRAKMARLRRDEWAARRPHHVVCLGCGTDFETLGQRSKYCSANCKQRHYWRTGRIGKDRRDGGRLQPDGR